MRKIIVGLAVSLDGLIEGPNGEYDWCFTDQDYGMREFMNRIDAIFYGRKSYEVMLSAEAEGQNPFGNSKSYVFSNTLTKPFPGTELISGDVKKKVTEIKKMPGKDIWLFGGSGLVGWFLNNDLVDELSLAVHPIILGAGKPLFENIQGRMKFDLVQSTPYSTGLVILHYRRKPQS